MGFVLVLVLLLVSVICLVCEWFMMVVWVLEFVSISIMMYRKLLIMVVIVVMIGVMLLMILMFMVFLFLMKGMVLVRVMISGWISLGIWVIRFWKVLMRFMGVFLWFDVIGVFVVMILVYWNFDVCGSVGLLFFFGWIVFLMGDKCYGCIVGV